MALLAAVVGGALPVCTRKLPEVSWAVVNSVGSLLMAGVFAPVGPEGSRGYRYLDQVV